MSEKKRMRFLKKIVLYNLIMLTVVTLAALVISWRAGDIPPGTVIALLGAWSVELILNAFIKTKDKTDNSI